jgi:outer membrane protein
MVTIRTTAVLALSIVAAAAMIVPSRAQSAASPTTAAQAFDLSQTISMALQSSNELLVATRTLDSDSAAVDASAAAGRPQVSSDDSYQHLDSPVVITFGPESIVAEKQDKEFLGATAALPIDISGRIRATTKASELQQMADQFSRDRIYNARVLQAESTYFDLLRAEHQVDVAQSALSNTQAQEDIAQRQFAAGVGQKIDYLRAQSQVASAQQDLLTAQNGLANERVVFNDLIGRPLNAPVDAADAAGVSTGLTVAADATDTTSVSAPVPAFYAPDLSPMVALDDALHTAQLARPELRADQVAIRAAQEQIKIARTGLDPSLSISAVGDYYPVTDFETPRHSLGIYSVNLNIPLYDGGLSRDQVREARDTEENAQSTFTSDQTTVQMQVREAYANLETAAQQITAANADLQQAIAARRLAQVRYGNGVGLYLEVTDAESALTQAETAQVNAVYGFFTARAQYENAIGTPDLNPSF